MLTPAEKKVLGLFMKSPHRKFGINEAARAVKTAVSRVFAILRKYEGDGLLKKSRVSTLALYSLNLDNEKTRKLLEFLSVEERDAFFKRNVRAKLLFSDILACDKGGLFESVVLFGSFARQEVSANDADVLIITGKHKKALDFVESAKPQMKKMHRIEIHPLIMSKSEFVRNFKNKKEVIFGIFADGIVVSRAEAYWAIVRDCVREAK